MNEIPHPPSTSPGGSPHNAPFGSGFFTWIRGLGISRGFERWFAGVAGGIAARANIDPIIVRGVFIVLAVLGGPGIVLYLAGWLLLPDQGGRIHLEEVFRGRAGAAAVIATVAVGIFLVLPAILRVFGITSVSGWSLWDALGMPSWLTNTVAVVVWIAVIAASIWLVSTLVVKHGQKVRDEKATAPADPHQSHRYGPPASPGGTLQGENSPAQGPVYATASASAFTEGAPSAGAGFDVPTAGGANGGAETPAPAAPRFTEQVQAAGDKAVRWSEDVGRQADEWSVRYAEQHERRQLGPAHIVITIAFALLAAGTIALVLFSTGLSPNRVLTGALLGATSVVAVSLIVAGVRGRRSGWVVTLAVLGVIALLFTSVFPAGTRVHPFGQMAVSVDDPGSVLIAGRSSVDLTPLDDQHGSDSVTVWHLVGRSEVVLPEQTPVVLKIRVLAGNIDTDESDFSPSKAAGVLLARTIDTRSSKTEPATEVTVYVLAGSVNVAARSAAAAAHTSSTTQPTRAEFQAELAALHTQEEKILTELATPGLSTARQQQLENALDYTRDEIAHLGKELAR